MNRRFHSTAEHRRQGSMVPALAFALLVVGGAMALTFDRLWQDAASIELQTAGDAAALAAAAELASDDTLRKDADWEAICDSARTAAAELAAENSVGGYPITLDSSRGGDIRLGTAMENSRGEKVFAETEYRPRTVRVRSWLQRITQNPVGLLVRDLSGAGRNMEAFVEAQAENRIVSLRPFEGANIPALPIALYAGSGALPGWDLAEQNLGPDTAGKATDSNDIERNPDGISETIAFCAPQHADEKQQLAATLHVIDIGAGLSNSVLTEQCEKGFSAEDLESEGGELRLDQGPRMFTSLPKVPGAVRSALEALVGEVRLCWVFNAAMPTANPAQCQVICPRLVGVRILNVEELPDGVLVMEVQPATIVTRTAIASEDGDDSLANPYLYKVYLSH